MTFDAVLVGGGLHNALLALAVLKKWPDARIAILERSTRICGEHTWSFHAGDLSPFMAQVVEGAVARRWDSYRVRFPDLERRILRPYASITSASLEAEVHSAVSRSPHARIFTGAEVIGIHADRVTVADGRSFVGAWVVDARGPQTLLSGGAPEAVQKFLGLELEVAPPAPVEPIIMDARVPQLDEFRFVYTLPLSPTRVLVEDTYYSASSVLDREVLRDRVRAYAEALGLHVVRVVREEHGVLPLPLEWTFAGARAVSPLRAGYGGGWFHPTTGYSLPCAARLAELAAASWPSLDLRAFAALAALHDDQARFAVLLNRLLFRAFAPDQRWRSLERFHRLPESTIERFYALNTTRADRARILLGRPPRGIQLGRAIRELAFPR